MSVNHMSEETYNNIPLYLSAMARKRLRPGCSKQDKSLSLALKLDIGVFSFS
jgi:hypothetical protein